MHRHDNLSVTVASFLLQVENTIRWRVKRDEEGNETRESNARIVKWSDGRCVPRQSGRCVVCWRLREHDVLCVLFTFPVLSAACPSTWGTKCLMFTKLPSRETTTTCSSDRVPDCRDRLCSKPSSRSGNMPSSCW